MTQEICRVCLQHSLEPINMAHTLYKDEISILTIFENCTGISSTDDGILCRNCELRLLDAYEFRCQAQESDSVWKNMVVPVVVKEETPEIFVQEEYLDDAMHDEPSILIKHEKEILMNPAIKHEKKQNKSLECRFCLKFVTTERLSDHEQVHITSNGGLECNFCHKKYVDRKRILEHLKCVHFTYKSNRPRYVCDICNKSYSNKSSLRTHERDVHTDTPKPKIKEVCPLCGKLASHLRKHIDMVHKNLITCYCDVCMKGFKTKGALLNHLKYLHLGIREVQCPHCSKYYRNQAEMETHIKGVHTSEQNFSCKICDKRFKTDQSLRFHVKMHQTGFDFCCDVCGARFKTKHYMLGHMKVHSEVKDFVCHVCDQRFKRSGQLTKHMRKHNGKMFTCSLCPDIRFIDRFSLKEHHERIHIGIRYRCDSCGKSYGSQKHLRKHQSTQMHDRNNWTKLVPSNIVVTSK